MCRYAATVVIDGRRINLQTYRLRHSGVRRNPEYSSTSWMPAFAGKTVNIIARRFRNGIYGQLHIAFLF